MGIEILISARRICMLCVKLNVSKLITVQRVKQLDCGSSKEVKALPKLAGQECKCSCARSEISLHLKLWLNSLSELKFEEIEKMLVKFSRIRFY
jgi:hypothetical protein